MRRAREFGTRAGARCRRSCASARGSAATATAIRSSTADDALVRDHARRRRSRSRTISTKCIALGAELSLSTRLVHADRRRCWRSPPRAHDANPHRQDEPYRQALVGIYARLAATARALTGYVPPRAPHVDAARRMRTPREFVARSRRDRRVARAARRDAARRAAGSMPLRRAVDVFGFHLAVARPAPEHRRARGGRRRAARAGPASSTDYAALAGGGARRAARRASSRARVRCTRRISTTRERARSELAILRSRRGHPRALRRGRAAELRDLEVPVGVRPARGRACC